MQRQDLSTRYQHGTCGLLPRCPSCPVQACMDICMGTDVCIQLTQGKGKLAAGHSSRSELHCAQLCPARAHAPKLLPEVRNRILVVFWIQQACIDLCTASSLFRFQAAPQGILISNLQQALLCCWKVFAMLRFTCLHRRTDLQRFTFISYGSMSACIQSMPLLLLLCLVQSQGALYCMSSAISILSMLGCKDGPAVMRSLLSIWKPCQLSCHRNWHRLLLLLHSKVFELPTLVIDSQNKTIVVLQWRSYQQGRLERKHGTERGHA